MGAWSDEERQREHNREVAFNLGAQSRDAEIARLKAEVTNQRHEIGMMLGEIARLRLALAAGPAALRRFGLDGYELAAFDVEAAQAAAMKDDKKGGG